MKFVVEIADDVSSDIVEDYLENGLACHVNAQPVVELPFTPESSQYYETEIEYAAALIRACYFLSSLFAATSLVKKLEEFLQYHGGLK